MTDIAGPRFLGRDAIRHVHETMALHRAALPVHRVRFERDEDDGWLVTRYDDVKRLLSDPRVRRNLSQQPMAAWQAAGSVGRPPSPHQFDDDPEYRLMARNVLYTDPPDHTRLRTLVNKTFTPRAVERLREPLTGLVDRLLDRMSGRAEVDLVTAFALPVPMFAICELLGVAEAERADFWGWSHVINGAATVDDRTIAEASEYLRTLVERKRAEPGDDLLSDLVAVSDEDGDRLSVVELVSMTLTLLVAGHDTTANLIANAVLALLRAPDQLAALRADMSLLPNAIEEVLRYDCPVHISTRRFAAEPIELAGVTIPAGETVLVSMLSANRDERQFPQPDRFDITRRAEHLGFGHGIHYCVGAPLARMETRIALAGLLTRFPNLRLAIDPAQLVARDSMLMHGPESLPVRLG